MIGPTISRRCVLNPIAAEGIGYTMHPYANKRSQPWEPKWEEDFGFAAAKYPVIATEFGGFARPPGTNDQPPAAASDRGNRNAAYGPAIIKYLEGKGISWTVWCFDPEWGPTLIGIGITNSLPRASSPRRPCTARSNGGRRRQRKGKGNETRAIRLKRGDWFVVVAGRRGGRRGASPAAGHARRRAGGGGVVAIHLWHFRPANFERPA